MGIGDQMLQWIASVYSAPHSLVKVNRVFSEPFLILNGTRQDIALSPLLFALTLESILNNIRLNPNISGIQGDLHHKVLAYADDMLFFLCPIHRYYCLNV